MTDSHPRPQRDDTGGRPPGAPRRRGPNALIWRWWNLLLLLPLLMLLTPWYNKDRPRLAGMPFFYWYQLAFVFVGVACVSIVYAATRTPSGAEPSGADPDDPASGRPGAIR